MYGGDSSEKNLKSLQNRWWEAERRINFTKDSKSTKIKKSDKGTTLTRGINLEIPGGTSNGIHPERWC